MKGVYQTKPLSVVACQYDGINLEEVKEFTKADLRESPLGGLFLFRGGLAVEKLSPGDYVVSDGQHCEVYEPALFPTMFDLVAEAKEKEDAPIKNIDDGIDG